MEFKANLELEDEDGDKPLHLCAYGSGGGYVRGGLCTRRMIVFCYLLYLVYMKLYDEYRLLEVMSLCMIMLRLTCESVYVTSRGVTLTAVVCHHA